ncbi:hypothetical protein F8388_005159 [Cannabis sativa]|uniref:Uncharacterized protein n=1 Tax=Cannabis sativa TaxID=3483 RepID=A0A7J6EJB8_CANSA|nr:hypothetical protein F8388_005159 [Cannabis sativa]
MGKKILDKEVDRISRTKTVNAAITSATLETPLHVAAGAKQSKFVEMLLKEDGIDPTLRDKKGNTAFCSAVVAGAMNIVQIFLHPKIMRREFLIHGGQDMTPLFIATSFGHGDIASTLYNCYQQQNIYMDQNERFDLANILLESEREDSTIAWMSDDFEVTCTALHYLSQKDPSIFANDQNRGIIKFDKISFRFNHNLYTSQQPPPCACSSLLSLGQAILSQHEYMLHTFDLHSNQASFKFNQTSHILN